MEFHRVNSVNLVSLYLNEPYMYEDWKYHVEIYISRLQPGANFFHDFVFPDFDSALKCYKKAKKLYS